MKKAIRKMIGVISMLVRPVISLVLMPARVIWMNVNAAIIAALASGGEYSRAIQLARDQVGSSKIEVLIMVFVAIVILYQLIPTVGNSNTTIQSSANVSSMGKFAAGLGEWLFPLFGVLGLVFLLWTKRGGGKKGKGSAV